MDDGGDLRPYEKGLIEQGLRILAGIDEAGRGPLAGPVVAAAVILDPDASIGGLKDSKLLSSGQRESLYGEISERAMAVAVEVVSEKVIDEINILRASHRAMAGAVGKLHPRPEYLLVDGHPNPELTIPQWPIVGGDRFCASIAAASIIAKVYRDSIMAEYHRRYPNYNFIRNKGYGTAEHRRALARYGPCPIHRRTFRGVREHVGIKDGGRDR